MSTGSNTFTTNISANVLTLRQTIEIEQQEEARIDKEIEVFKKKFLKKFFTKKYKLVSTRKEASIIIIYDRVNSDTLKFHVNDEKSEELKPYEVDSRYTLIYLKNKNPRDTKATAIGDVKRMSLTYCH